MVEPAIRFRVHVLVFQNPHDQVTREAYGQAGRNAAFPTSIKHQCELLVLLWSEQPRAA